MVEKSNYLFFVFNVVFFFSVLNFDVGNKEILEWVWPERMEQHILDTSVGKQISEAATDI